MEFSSMNIRSLSESDLEPAANMATARGTLPAVAFVVLWSTGYIAGKTAVLHAAPFTVLTLRFGGASLMFAVLVAWLRPAWPGLRVVVHSAGVGLLTLALQFGGVYEAFSLGSSSGFAALVIGSMPLATSLAAAAMGEKQRVNHWIGLFMGFAGVLLVLEDRLGSGLGSAAAGFALIVGLCGFTFGTLYQKRHAVNVDFNIGLLSQNLAATVVLAPVALLHEHLRFDATPAFVGSMLWMILVNSGAAFILLFLLLRHGAATRVSTLFYLVTPVTAVMGWALMGEPMSAVKLLGFALAAGGVYIGTRR
jgi:drug/metabolite transporter (DMT)-like permease